MPAICVLGFYSSHIQVAIERSDLPSTPGPQVSISQECELPNQNEWWLSPQHMTADSLERPLLLAACIMVDNLDKERANIGEHILDSFA